LLNEINVGIFKLNIRDSFGVKEFESRYGQEFSLLHVGQTGCGVHPPSSSMGTGDSFLGGIAAGA
jgi:hypothetical protein